MTALSSQPKETLMPFAFLSIPADGGPEAAIGLNGFPAIFLDEP